MTVAGRFMFALFRADPQERPSSNAIRPVRAYGGLNGNDLRRDALAVRQATLASLVARAAPELRLSEHLDHDDGALVFKPACRLGLEGIVSKAALAGLDQEQESERAGREARGRGGLGQMVIRRRSLPAIISLSRHERGQTGAVRLMPRGTLGPEPGRSGLQSSKM
jgi:hypothetical protein